MYKNCCNSLCALRKSDEVWFFGFVWGFFARFLASLLNSNRSFQLDSYFFSWNSLELTDVIQTGRHVLSANIRQDVIQGICSSYRFFFFFHVHVNAGLSIFFSFWHVVMFQSMCVLPIIQSFVFVLALYSTLTRAARELVRILKLQPKSFQVFQAFSLTHLFVPSLWQGLAPWHQVV